jgi:hypothetical protein
LGVPPKTAKPVSVPSFAGEGKRGQAPQIRLRRTEPVPFFTLADPSIYYPTAEGVWKVGRRLAGEGAFTEYHRLLPIYARRSEAERLWELRHNV